MVPRGPYDTSSPNMNRPTPYSPNRKTRRENKAANKRADRFFKRLEKRKVRTS